MKTHKHQTTFKEVPSRKTGRWPQVETWNEEEKGIFVNQVTRSKLSREDFENHQLKKEKENIGFIIQFLD